MLRISDELWDEMATLWVLGCHSFLRAFGRTPTSTETLVEELEDQPEDVLRMLRYVAHQRRVARAEGIASVKAKGGA